ncbi:MAG: hypothetical protein JSU70_01040, partial [Phycisphaerales bacterium]
DGSIVACYASGAVSGTGSNRRFGDLVGLNWGNIVHCYSTGAMIHYLVGEDWGGTAQSYAVGPVSCGGEAGGWSLATYAGSGTVTSRISDVKKAGGAGLSDHGRGSMTVQVQHGQIPFAAGWDFVDERANGTADMWWVPEGYGCPLLTVFLDDHPPRELEGAGTADDPYRITSAEDLGAICHYDAMAHYELVADIDLSRITWTTAPIPIFGGVLNGNDFTVSNLTIRGGDYLGLFGTLWMDAIVENLRIKDANIVGAESAISLGVLAAENWGRVAHCRAAGEISGGGDEQRLGSLVGWNLGTIEDCDPMDCAGPYSVIVRDPNATRDFLRFAGIQFNQVWIPEETDIEGLDSVLWTYLDSDSTYAHTFIDRDHILANLPRYDREYSGFILDDSKYIICSMIAWSGIQGGCYVAKYEEPPGTIFTLIADGGCGVVTVIFDAESKTVVGIECNGEG